MARMHKKDYVLLAKVLGNAHKTIINDKLTAEEAFHYIVGAISATFTLDNPLFDRDRFFKEVDKQIIQFKN